MGSNNSRQNLDKAYGIGYVSRRTGLSQFTLRAWETRYGTTRPRRTATGRRRYSDEDIERLTLLRLLTERGHVISDIAGLDAARLMTLMDKDADRGPGSDVVVAALISALARLELAEVGSLLRAAQMQYDTRTFLLYVLAPFMRRLGAEVASGSKNVYHEHAASALIRSLLSSLLFSATGREHGGPPILFATPEGDQHEFGILIAAVLAILQGRQVFYLGPNMPAESLARAAADLKCELAVVAMSAPEQSMAPAALEGFVRETRKRLPSRCRLWLAGSRAGTGKTEVSGRVQVVSGFEDFERRLRALER